MVMPTKGGFQWKRFLGAVSPQRDGVLLGFSANTAVADRTSLYFRYEGDFSGADSSHALTAGVRISW